MLIDEVSGFVYDSHVMYKITIREGKDKLLVKHHPWVFTGAIGSVEPAFSKADEAEVYSADGRFIAYGWYDEKSHIVLHLLSWDKEVPADDIWLEKALKAAILRRARYFSAKDTNCFRLIHGEADFIPGVACDVYGSEVRMIISSRYANDKLDLIVRTIGAVLKPSLITVTADSFYAKAEGLKENVRCFDKDGKAAEEKSGNIRFRESGIIYEIERGCGQKSGFYCDQRDNRNIVEEYAEGRNVLDACSFTGAFTLHALRGGAKKVTALDSSESALRHLLYQVHINEDEGILPSGSRDKVEIRTVNVFEELRNIEKNTYDLMILDPPKLAQTKGKLENALKAYKDLNRVAMMKIRNGGIIATFSCSGAVTRETFRQTIAWAASDAGVEVQIIRTLSAGDDHPVRSSFPESEYLKGYILRVIK